ncbi:MAG: C69 family dipeptidase [Acidobacteria bacterium]|nr:C69 family dipeptidase [Acidobacteriota bacterium]
MNRTLSLIIIAAGMIVSLTGRPAHACTSILVTKGASKDGSTMITYAMDSHELYGKLAYRPAGIHIAGTMRNMFSGESGAFLGRVKEAPFTYARVGHINEHQLAIAETTFTGREELAGPSGIVDYDNLMWIALERAKTAREAVETMAGLVDEYGYASTGESISIADPNEVWIFEIIGKGKGQKGAVWVAMKVPDGTISAHANLARIRQFPLNDPQNCLYAKDVISFAREKGWFKGEDKAFSFADTYCPPDFSGLRFCESRVWSVFRRSAPSLNLSSDFMKGVKNATLPPLWIKPDSRLSVRDVMELMRDHFEDTEFDMRKDVGAGPFELPYRWRPMEWELDGRKYLHERAISTQQTGASFVTQSRSWLPDPIGGIIWFGMDDSYSSVYVPFYCGIQEVPKAWGEESGSFDEFSWDSAFWVFNWVANTAYGRYSDMIMDIQTVQRELEGKFMAEQPDAEADALKLYEQSPFRAREFLTRYSASRANLVMERWKKLGEFLLWKYLDGNIHTDKGMNSKREHPPYSDAWYRRIVQEKGDAISIPRPDQDK